jgi:cobalt-zinc-cadmium efflux system protein
MMAIWQWYLADPIVSIIVGGLILFSAWSLVKESVDVLLESSPRHLNISHILTDLRSMKGVVSVHDLHVWSIASGTTAMSCHIVLKSNQDAERSLVESSHLMRQKYGIEHTTIQIEFDNWNIPSGENVVGPTPHCGEQ